MTVWIMTIAGVSILIIITNILLPNGKMSKTIKRAASMVLIVIIIAPIPQIIKNKFDFNAQIFEFNYNIDQNYADYTNKYLINCISDDIEEQLENDGFKGVVVMIDFITKNDEIFINNVVVNIQNLVIENQSEHIDKYKIIRECVLENLSVDSEKVVIVNE